MKKLLVLALSAMILACGSVSASALVSPGLNDGSQGDSGKPADKDNNADKKPTSPSTGVSASAAIYAAMAALTCGGVAVIAKKKVSE